MAKWERIFGLYKTKGGQPMFKMSQFIRDKLAAVPDGVRCVLYENSRKENETHPDFHFSYNAEEGASSPEVDPQF